MTKLVTGDYFIQYCTITKRVHFLWNSPIPMRMSPRILIAQEGDIVAGLFAIKVSEPARMSPFWPVRDQIKVTKYTNTLHRTDTQIHRDFMITELCSVQGSTVVNIARRLKAPKGNCYLTPNKVEGSGEHGKHVPGTFKVFSRYISREKPFLRFLKHGS